MHLKSEEHLVIISRNFGPLLSIGQQQVVHVLFDVAGKLHVLQVKLIHVFDEKGHFVGHLYIMEKVRTKLYRES